MLVGSIGLNGFTKTLIEQMKKQGYNQDLINKVENITEKETETPIKGILTDTITETLNNNQETKEKITNKIDEMAENIGIKEPLKTITDTIKEKEQNGNNTEEQNGNNNEENPTENATDNTPSIKEIWEREDAIRKEIQGREDTAYQRAVEDMRKAGINPNLVGINPAESGGGVMQTAGQSTLNTELNNIIQATLNQINNEVKMSENQKDRTADILRTLAMILLVRK